MTDKLKKKHISFESLQKLSALITLRITPLLMKINKLTS
jgi:hypothetical protein